jgi:hypothetical protein
MKFHKPTLFFMRILLAHLKFIYHVFLLLCLMSLFNYWQAPFLFLFDFHKFLKNLFFELIISAIRQNISSIMKFHKPTLFFLRILLAHLKFIYHVFSLLCLMSLFNFWQAPFLFHFNFQKFLKNVFFELNISAIRQNISSIMKFHKPTLFFLRILLAHLKLIYHVFS